MQPKLRALRMFTIIHVCSVTWILMFIKSCIRILDKYKRHLWQTLPNPNQTCMHIYDSSMAVVVGWQKYIQSVLSLISMASTTSPPLPSYRCPDQSHHSPYMCATRPKQTHDDTGLRNTLVHDALHYPRHRRDVHATRAYAHMHIHLHIYAVHKCSFTDVYLSISLPL